MNAGFGRMEQGFAGGPVAGDLGAPRLSAVSTHEREQFAHDLLASALKMPQRGPLNSIYFIDPVEVIASLAIHGKNATRETMARFWGAFYSWLTQPPRIEPAVLLEAIAVVSPEEAAAFGEAGLTMEVEASATVSADPMAAGPPAMSVTGVANGFLNGGAPLSGPTVNINGITISIYSGLPAFSALGGVISARSDDGNGPTGTGPGPGAGPGGPGDTGQSP